MEIITTLICGNEQGNSVLASSYSGDQTILFIFPFLPWRPASIASRVVACYHEKLVAEPEFSFPSMDMMRQAIYAAISKIWQHYASHPAIHYPDVVVYFGEDQDGSMTWRICHESVYRQYVESLMQAQHFQSSLSQPIQVTFLALETLCFSTFLGGRGDTTMAHIKNSVEPRSLYVYKGLSFRCFLERGTGFTNERQAFYQELFTIYNLPKHPNIIPRPYSLITTTLPILDTSLEGQNLTYICGVLYPYFPKGSLQEALDQSNAAGKRLPLILKAKWASQIASAMAATYKSGQYHMDLKPSNILLDENDNAVIIDWEQSGASPFFLALEADGSWDVEIEFHELNTEKNTRDDAEKPKMIYRKRTGTPNKDQQSRNIFSLWQTAYPVALQAAEVYSLGRTLWVTFEQIGEDDVIGRGDSFVPRPTCWGEYTDDIPPSWKDFLNDCTDSDPNKRPDINTVVSFVEREYLALQMSKVELL